MKPEDYVIPIASSGSTAGLMTRVLPGGKTEYGYLSVGEDDCRRINPRSRANGSRE